MAGPLRPLLSAPPARQCVRRSLVRSCGKAAGLRPCTGRGTRPCRRAWPGMRERDRRSKAAQQSIPQLAPGRRRLGKQSTIARYPKSHAPAAPCASVARLHRGSRSARRSALVGESRAAGALHRRLAVGRDPAEHPRDRRWPAARLADRQRAPSCGASAQVRASATSLSATARDLRTATESFVRHLKAG